MQEDQGIGYHSQARSSLLESLEGFFGDLRNRKLEAKLAIVAYGELDDIGKVNAEVYHSIDFSKIRKIVFLTEGKELAYSSETWNTPLGKVDTDQGLVEKIREEFERNETAFKDNFEIEEQLIFLQYRLDEFEFLPLTIPDEANQEKVSKLVEKLKEATGPHDLVIVPFNFAKINGEEKEKVVQKDHEIVKALEEQDIKKFQKEAEEEELSGRKALEVGIRSKDLERFHRIRHDVIFKTDLEKGFSVGIGGFCYT
ncbi:MAG: AmmeMemoRadiSam system protein B [Candidatus Nanohaloarchaeota archaeon QJJ-9]|nr:AmmeMemoRadiSam system protein B [Candidatus Nanohaloarchaeota archaeon QJJ-9]